MGIIDGCPWSPLITVRRTLVQLRIRAFLRCARAGGGVGPVFRVVGARVVAAAAVVVLV